MKRHFVFAAGILAAVSLVGTNFAGAQSTAGGITGGGTGITQPGVIVYPIQPPKSYPYPQGNDVVQFNNLSIQSVSGTVPPAEIVAVNYYEVQPMGAVPSTNSAQPPSSVNCYKFESLGSGASTPVNCPTPVTLSPTTPPSALTPNVATSTMQTAPSLFPPPYLGGYKIEVDANTRLMLRDRSTASLSDFSAGDRINVFGIYNSDGTIQALIVRNLSKPVERQFIQLNNVEVVSVSAAKSPADIIVIQQTIYPCYDFGKEGASNMGPTPCPLGLRSFSENPSSANVKTPESLWRINAARKYVVKVDSQTIIMNRERGRLNLSDIQVGDKLNVYGSTIVDSTALAASGEIDADLVRDITQPVQATTFSGQVTQVNSDGSFVIQTQDGELLTVQNPIQIGVMVKLKGLLDQAKKIISQVSEMMANTNVPPSAVKPPSSSQVYISSIDPLSGPVGVLVTLRGAGFTSTNNIRFGYGVIPNLASSDGTSISFNVPGVLNPLCYFSTPSCLAPSQMTQPGAYPVSVTNTNGSSNEVKFVVTSGAGGATTTNNY